MKTVKGIDKNANLLFLFHLVSFGRLLYHEHILGCFQVVQLAESLVVEVTQSHVILQVYLVQ